MIAHEDHDRVLPLAGVVEHLQYPAHVVVDLLDHRVIGSRDFPALATRHLAEPEQHAAVSSVVVDLLEDRFVLQFARLILGIRQFVRIIAVEVLLRRIEGMVRIEDVDAHQPSRPAPLLYEVYRPVKTPCCLMQIRRNTRIRVLAIGAIHVLPLVAFRLEPLDVLVLLPLRVRIMAPVKDPVTIINSLLHPTLTGSDVQLA